MTNYQQYCLHHGKAHWEDGFGWRCTDCGGRYGNHGGSPGSGGYTGTGGGNDTGGGGGGGMLPTGFEKVKTVSGKEVFVQTYELQTEGFISREEAKKPSREEVIKLVDEQVGRAVKRLGSV